MKCTKFIPFFFVTVVTLCILGLASLYNQRDHAPEADNTVARTVLHRHIFDKNKVTQIYDKIKIPAKLSFELSEDLEAPVTLKISAISEIPVSSGKITLKIPQIGNEQAGNIELWSGNPSDFVDESLEYTLADLPVGTYRFIIIFEFIPLGEETEPFAFSKSLYLDVRTTEILSSNVSFRHINRLELMKELEERVLADMQPGLENADTNTKAAVIASIESFDHGLLIRKIEQLKNSDPQVAREIMELNRIESDETGESEDRELFESNELDIVDEKQKISSPIFYGQPATVQEVSVPEELKK